MMELVYHVPLEMVVLLGVKHVITIQEITKLNVLHAKLDISYILMLMEFKLVWLVLVVVKLHAFLMINMVKLMDQEILKHSI